WVIDAKQWNHAVAAYLACVEYVDTQTGKVLEALAKSPHASNTIIVLWSDHGWHLGEKQHWGKWTGWERSTRVPLAIVLPESMRSSEFAQAFRPGRKVDTPTSLIDLYPTLVELAGLPRVDGLDGESLTGDTSGVRVVNLGRGSYTVVEGSWRYIHYFDGSEELYNLASDPNQYRNLAAVKSHQAKLAAMRNHL
ncbi:MAG: sulfatase-like hydrolase/transferase, partial [bacterium]|nr:sulfatase-like hydrolase/transferase [bacterium]